LFLPDEHPIPPGFEGRGFKVRPITIHDVVKDYDAVMTSANRLRERFPLWGWPPEDGMSLEDDLVDLAWHQKEAQLRRSFKRGAVARRVTRARLSVCLGRRHLQDAGLRPDRLPPCGAAGGRDGGATVDPPAAGGRRGTVQRDGCVNCHGPNGLGGVPNPQSPDKTIPPLSGQDFRKEFNTDAKVIAVIRSGSVIGKAPIVSMPHWGGIISDKQLRALVAYLKTLK
jgi:mono/diheme cytochrome c family protein